MSLQTILKIGSVAGFLGVCWHFYSSHRIKSGKTITHNKEIDQIGIEIKTEIEDPYEIIGSSPSSEAQITFDYSPGTDKRNKEWLIFLKKNETWIRKKYSHLIGVQIEILNYSVKPIVYITSISFGVWVVIKYLEPSESIIIRSDGIWGKSDVDLRWNDTTINTSIFKVKKTLRYVKVLSRRELSSRLNYHIPNELLDIIVSYTFEPQTTDDWTRLTQWFGDTNQEDHILQKRLLLPLTGLPLNWDDD